MNIQYLIELVLLGALWGGSFIFLRVSSPEFGPIPLVVLRTAIATLFLLPFLHTTKQYSELIENWRPIFILSLISTVLPYSLFSYTTLHATAGYTAIINATTPMFAAIIAYFWVKEYMTKSGIAGILIGFIGVFVLVFDKESMDIDAGFLPFMAALFAAFLYGVTGNYSKSRFADVSPLVSAIGSQLVAAIILLPFSIYFWPVQAPANSAWLSAVALGVACTGIALILYFRLIRNVGVAKTVTVTYLIPVFGILWGYIFLGENITLNMLFGGMLILAGVGLTTGLIRLDRKTRLAPDSEE